MSAVPPACPFLLPTMQSISSAIDFSFTLLTTPCRIFLKLGLCLSGEGKSEFEAEQLSHDDFTVNLAPPTITIVRPYTGRIQDQVFHPLCFFREEGLKYLEESVLAGRENLNVYLSAVAEIHPLYLIHAIDLFRKERPDLCHAINLPTDKRLKTSALFWYEHLPIDDAIGLRILYNGILYFENKWPVPCERLESLRTRLIKNLIDHLETAPIIIITDVLPESDYFSLKELQRKDKISVILGCYEKIASHRLKSFIGRYQTRNSHRYFIVREEFEKNRPACREIVDFIEEFLEKLNLEEEEAIGEFWKKHAARIKINHPMTFTAFALYVSDFEYYFERSLEPESGCFLRISNCKKALKQE